MDVNGEVTGEEKERNGNVGENEGESEGLRLVVRFQFLHCLRL